jgi:hypothetical protein
MLAALLLTSIGCSLFRRSLSSEEAQRLIEQSKEFRANAYIAVDLDGGNKSCAAKRAEDATWRSVETAGWIKTSEWVSSDDFVPLGGGRFQISLAAGRCKGDLTDEGKRLSAGWVSESGSSGPHAVWKIPVAARTVIAITKLVSGDDGKATAQFRCGWKATEFGTKLNQPLPERSGEAAFRRAEGGWRLEGFGPAGVPQI